MAITKLHQSVLQTEAHERVSGKYAFVPSTDILAILAESGWEPVSQKVATVRKKEFDGYQTHVIRLRNPEYANLFHVGGEFPEIVFRNEHKGSSAILLLCGIFRLVCTNGLVTGREWQSYRIPHVGFARFDVERAVSELVGTIPQVMQRVEDFKAIELTPDEQGVYAESAVALKHGEEFVGELTRLLYPMRTADRSPTLWNTFNIVQERLVKGNYRTRGRDERPSQGKKRPPVKGVDAELKLNRALWTLTERMAEIKGLAGPTADSRP